MSADLPYRPRRRFSALTRRILFFNVIALLILVGGVLWVQSNRIGLVEERVAGIRDQALIVAGALAEYATEPDRRTIQLMQAEPLLRQLIAPTRLRARVYSTVGRLQLDTRNLLARNVVTTEELPPPEPANPVMAFFSRMTGTVERLYDGLMGVRPLAHLDPYFEAGQNGRVYEEVNRALAGETGSSVRVNEQDKLVLSVAVPIRRFATLYGVLMLTTESGDIDDILKAERTALVEVFAVAFVALLFSAVYLAGFIAAPILKLAGAAERVRRGRAGRDAIPTLDGRDDEIGELADSLSAMTRALYERIDAIESFAADVAHELKNPLTSLKSAIEMFERTKDGENRERLVQVIRNDVKRIDRLITDISDASRLDAELSRGHSEPIDLSKLLDTIVDIYTGLDVPRGVRIAFAEDSDKSAIVQGLDARLGQVFRNLIDNAISFSPDGGTVLVSDHVSGPHVRGIVEDSGPGIPEDDLERVFGRFYTERPPEHGFGKNSGLGLAIARQIVASHGGRIWAENKYNSQGQRTGACFIVELPLLRTAE
ncbi:MAG TPA: stimulus-sensing domain-containing protein [Micropepsaceae bacterium]|jgi:two-component system sensor histidine kinase ChvG|nr:stimulus-sensing domain-containing protein [Micropepsaceae bacterium]